MLYVLITDVAVVALFFIAAKNDSFQCITLISQRAFRIATMWSKTTGGLQDFAPLVEKSWFWGRKKERKTEKSQTNGKAALRNAHLISLHVNCVK